jgi:alcohol dehydrogenase
MGPYASRAGARALLVTDAGVRAAGHALVCERVLRDAGLEVLVYDTVPENPTRTDARDLGSHTSGFRPDLVVAIGGGSAIDCAKGGILALTQPGGLDERHGRITLERPTLPMFAIPTTSGTGSECQSATLLADDATGSKRAVLAPGLLPRLAVLDPAFTASQPDGIALAGALDAVTHGVEAAVTRAQTVRSRRYALAALRLLLPHLGPALDDPRAIDSRGAMLLGASIAGMAIEQSMLGAAHALANPLTAQIGIPHGLAVGLMLPAVTRYNSALERCHSTYASIARSTGLTRGAGDDERAVEALIEVLESFASRARHALSVKQGHRLATWDRAALASDAAEQWTGGFNPREVDPAGYRELYDRALGAPQAGGVS